MNRMRNNQNNNMQNGSRARSTALTGSLAEKIQKLSFVKAELELYLERSEYIKESLVYEPDPDAPGVIAAAVIPDDENVQAYLSRQGISHGDGDYASAERKLMEDIVREQNLKFPHYKHIQKVYVRHRDFIKTTTRKIKRNEKDNLDNESVEE